MRFPSIRFAGWLAAGAFLTGASCLVAQSYNLSSLEWRSLGPNRGGRSQTGVGSVARPLEYYFGADGGGLWKTVDGGFTWKPVTDGQIHSSSVSAVAVAESNPDVVYIGTGETALRGDIIQGDGVYKSTDAGKTWKHIGLENTQAISRIRVDPAHPDIVYVAALGHPYGASPDRGIYRSKDGGATWKRVLYRNDRTGAADLVLDPHNPQVLYASFWDVYRTPWTLSSGGSGSGLFKSTDGGDTWQEITRNPGLPQDLLGKITVTVSGADSKRVYAMVEAADGGLFRSDDAGATWKLVNEEHKIRQRAFYFSIIQADPKLPDRIYALNVEFYRSDDGGKTFNLMHTPHGDHHDLWIAPDNSQRMIAADDGGGAVSVDGAQTWSTHVYPTAQFYHVALTAGFPYDVCGAQQDDNTICVPTHAPGGENAAMFNGMGSYVVGDSEAGYVAADPKNSSLFYYGNQAGMISRYDRAAGVERSITVYPLFFSGMSAAVLPERWQWTFPIVFSPVDPNVLYTSSQHLFKTSDQGQHWDTISPDLTRNDPKTLGDSGGPITKDQNGPEIYGTIFAIAPSHFDVNTIWTGSDDGLIQLTRDGGKHWTNVTPSGLGEFNRISWIDASPHDPGTAYVAAKRYQLDDRAPYLFKTHDYGKTWTKIVDGIGPTDFAQVIREDPARAGLLYAGTEHGIYISFNDGASWLPFSLNLPDTQVSDLAFAQHDLVISTHGRGFYVLDNIDMLRQLSPQVAAAPATLFVPTTVVRSIEPALIDYYLAQPAKDVRLDILDAQSAVIATFTNAASTRSSGEATEGRRANTGTTLSGAVGAHRFHWDLHYPPAASFPGLILRYGDPVHGPLAPPGTYTVRLTIDAKTLSQKLTIQRDPNLSGVTDADLQQQFKLAIQVRDSTSLANRTVIQIRAVDHALDQSATGADLAPLQQQAKAIETRLEALELELYQVRNQSPRDTLNYPIKLNNQLAALEQMVDMGSYKPTDQDYVVFEELTARLNGIVSQVDAVLKTDLPALNRQLTAHHLQAITAATR